MKHIIIGGIFYFMRFTFITRYYFLFQKQMKVEVEESEMIGDLGQSLPVELTANSGNPNVNNNNNNNNNQSSNKKNHHHHHHHHLNHQQQHQRHPDFPYYGPDPMSIPLNPHVSSRLRYLYFVLRIFSPLFTTGTRRYCLVCLFVLEIKVRGNIINVNRSNNDIFGCFKILIYI